MFNRDIRSFSIKPGDALLFSGIVEAFLDINLWLDWNMNLEKKSCQILKFYKAHSI